jgi:hypothetical protein
MEMSADTKEIVNLTAKGQDPSEDRHFDILYLNLETRRETPLSQQLRRFYCRLYWKILDFPKS